jgi:hypothetical protein
MCRVFTRRWVKCVLNVQGIHAAEDGTAATEAVPPLQVRRLAIDGVTVNG